MKKNHSSVYHPASNGVLERSHLDLCNYLWYFVALDTWDLLIKYALFAFNTFRCSSTGYSSFEITYGRKCRFPTSFAEGSAGRTYNQAVDKLIHKLKEICTNVRSRAMAARVKTKQYCDQRLNVEDFKDGEWVYVVYSNFTRTNKLGDTWIGPYEIIGAFDNHTLLLEITPNFPEVVHKNNCKLTHLRLDQ